MLSLFIQNCQMEKARITAPSVKNCLEKRYDEQLWIYSSYQILVKKKEKDQRRLFAVLLLLGAFLVVLLLVVFLLLGAFLVVFLLVFPADARRLRLVPAFFLAATFAAAFLFRVRAAFLADAARFAFDIAILKR